MNSRAHRNRTRILGAVGAVLLVAGVIAIVVALRAQQSAPQPPPAAARSVSVIPPDTSPAPSGSTAADGTTPKSKPTTRGQILSRSLPTHLSVPAIGVDSDLKQIGLNAKGEIQTPPLVRDSHAYWLNVSPTPGQLGPATIIGHVDSAAYGPGVFFRLGDLRQRDKSAGTR